MKTRTSYRSSGKSYTQYFKNCKNCEKNYWANRKVQLYCSRKCSSQDMKVIKNPKEKYFREKITRLRNNARKRNIAFNLNWEDLLKIYNQQKGLCFYTGKVLQLTYSTKTRKVCPPDQLSVDRLDSNKGYTIDNTSLCCYAINNFKGDSTVREFLDMINTINQKPLKVKFKKLHSNAVTPKYSKPGDGGMDLTATSYHFDEEKQRHVYGTGLAVEIPYGFVGLIFPRSSICKYDLRLSNCVGVIDSGYRGEIKFFFENEGMGKPSVFIYKNGKEISYEQFENLKEKDDIFVSSGLRPEIYKIGDRIGQLIIMPYPQIELEEVEELNDSDRGEGGFGSSGK